MSIEKTVKLQVDTEDAIKRLEAVEAELGEISKTSKKTESQVGKLERGFRGVGLAFKAMGVGLVLKAFELLSEQMMKNQAIADTVETVFNSIGVVFKLVTDSIVNTYNAVAKSTENFDALGRVAKNVLDIAITPLKISFQTIKLGIQAAMLAWEKSFLGGKGKDIERIKELTADIEATKQSIKDTATEALNSGKEIVGDFVEAVGEITNISTVVVDEFKKTFEGVTVNSIIEQGKAITQTKKNYGLLALEQQRLIEKYDREAEVLRQQRDDIRLTVDERIAANDKLAGVLEKQTQAEKDAIQAQIDSVKQLNDLEGETPERMEELFSLKTEMIAIDAKIAGLSSEQKTNEAALQDERIANLQELTSIGKSELEQQMSDIEIEAENRRTLAMRTISDQQVLQDTLVAIDRDAAKKKADIERAVAATRRDIVANSLGQVASLLGEQSKAGKALAVGQALINTYSAAAAALAPPPIGAGPIFGPIAAIGAIAAGMMNVKQILSTKLPGDSGGGGGGGPEPAVPQDTGLGPMSPNMEAVEQPTLGGGSQPAQAYVVENDISNAQALQNELDIQATL
tara:strand:+ start:111 stop:1826 length:1716 start_codon:yes stop_codon:yes gene_type:complete